MSSERPANHSKHASSVAQTKNSADDSMQNADAGALVATAVIRPETGPTTVSWKSNVNGLWSVAANWTGGAVPGANNAVVLDTLSARTVTFASGTGTIYSINAITDTLNLSGGTLTVLNSAVFNAGLTETATNGSQTLILDGATASVAGTFNPGIGNVFLGTATTLSVSGPAILGTGVDNQWPEIDGGTLATSGTTTIGDPGDTGYPQLVIGGGIAWDNSGVVNDGGVIYTGDGNGATAAIVNAAGAVFDIISDDGEIVNGTVSGVAGAGSSMFSNAGTLEKIGGNGGVSAIYSAFSNTGLINVQTGTIAFDSGGVFGGTLTGAGTIIFGGNGTLTSGSVFNAASLEAIGSSLVVSAGATVNGSFLIVNGNLTVSSGATFTPVGVAMAAGTFSLSQNLALGSGEFSDTGGEVFLNGTTLSVNAANLLFSNYTVGGYVDGPGTLVTSGASSVVNGYGYYNSQALYLGDGVTWTNAGTVSVTDNIDVDPNYANGFSIVNQAGAAFDFSNTATYGGNYTVDENAANTSTFLNSGLVAETGAYGEGIGSTFTNTATGTLSVASGGLLSFDAGGVFSGLMTGAGTMQFGGASATLTSGSVFNATSLNAYSNSFVLSAGASINGAVVGVYDSFSVSSGSTFNVAGVYVGGGALSLSGSAAVTISSLGVAAGSVYLANNLTLGSGDFSQTGGDIYLDGTTLSVAGASFSFSAYNTPGYVDGPGALVTSGASSVVNGYGYYTYQALDLGGGLTWTNTGTVSVTDNINVDPNTTTGFSIVNQAGAAFDFSGTSIYSGGYTVGENVAVSSTFLNSGLVAEIGAYTQGIGSIFTNTATGTLSAASGGLLSFDSGGVFSGLMTGAGTIQLGGASATLIAGSVFNAATLNADSSNLVLSAGADINSAAVNVADNFTVSSGSTFSVSALYVGGNLSLSSSAAVKITSLDVGAGSMSLGSNLTLGAGDFSQTGGDIYLDGATLSLTGASFSFPNYNSPGYVDGPGALVTSGASSVVNSYGYYYYQALNLGGGMTWTNTGTVSVTDNIDVDTNYATGFGIVNQAGAAFDFSDNTAYYTGPYTVGENAAISSTFLNNGLVAETGAYAEGIGSFFTNTATGTLSVATGGTLSLDGGGSLAGTAVGKGTLLLNSSSGLTLSGLSTSATTSVTLAVGDSLTVAANSTFAGTLTASSTSIGLNAGATLSMTGAKTFGSGPYYYAVYVTGPGTLATSGSTNVVDYAPGYVMMDIEGGGTWANSGTVTDAGLIQLGDASGGGTLSNLAGATFNMTTSDAGIVQGTYTNGFGATLPAASTFINAGLLEKTGAAGTSSIYATFVSTGTIASTIGTLALDNGGSLSGLIADKSHILLSNGVGFSAGNLAVGGGASLANAVTIDDTGTLTLGDSTSATLASIFSNTGTYEIDGNGGIVVGASSTATDLFSNTSTGLLEKIAGTGRSVVSANVANTGTILANAGTLALTGTLTGAGKLQIGAGATLELGASVPTTQTITFTANTGTLALDTVTGTHAAITGFTVGDEIDLVNTTANSATLTGTTLVVYNGSTADTTLSLTGTHTGDTYSFLSDGHGGTLLGISANASAWKGTSSDWNATNVWTNGPPSLQTNATVNATGKYTLALASSETASARTLLLDGTMATYAISGLLNIGSAITLEAGTLLLAGTIDGGTLTLAGGTTTYNGGTLDNVVLQGALTLAGASQSLTLENPFSLTGAGGSGSGTINITGAGSTLFVDGITTLSQDVISLGNATGFATLTSNDADGNGGVLTLDTNTTLTQTGLYAALSDSGGAYDAVLNSGTITAAIASGTFAISGADFENDSILSLSKGDTLDIASASFVNAGTLTSSASTLTLGGTFQNTGSITTTNTVLNLNGTLSTAQLPGLFGGGDTINLGGTLVNTGATLTIGTGTALGQMSLDGGTILGGTIADAGAGLLTNPYPAAYGTLSGVTYDGTLNVTGGVTILGSFTATGASGSGAGTIVDTGSNSELIFTDTRTLNNVAISLGNSSIAYISVNDDTGNGATLTLGAGATITQAGASADLYYYESNNEIINQGSILAGSSGGTFYALSNGTGTFFNQGSITVSNGDVFALSTGGIFANLSGTTLTGGSIIVNTGSSVQLANNVAIGTDAATLTLNGAASYIESLNTTTNKEAQLDSQISSISAVGVLNLSNGRNLNAVANHGSFSVAGQLNLSSSNFTATALSIAGGTLSGHGTVSGAVADAGVISAGGGTLQFNGAVTGTGSLTAAAGAILDLTQAGTLSEAISGAGTLKLDGATYALAAGNSLAIATIAVDAGVALSGSGTLAGSLADAGALSVTTGTLLVGGAVTGAGTLAAASGAILDLAAGGSFGGAITGAGLLQLDGADTLTILSSGSLGIGSVVVDAPSTLDLFDGGALNGAISGAGTLQLDGTTPYTLAGSLGIATLLIDPAAGLSGSGTIAGAVIDNGNLGAASNTLTVDGLLSGTGTLYAAGNAALSLLGGGTLSQTISGAGTLQLGGAATYTLGGGTVGVSTVALQAGATLSGTGTLSGSVTDAGTLAASGGLLQVTGALSGAGALSAGNGAVLDLTLGEALTEAVSGTGTLQLDGGTYTLSGGADTIGTLAVDAGAALSGYGSVAGAITDAGTITAAGGTLMLGAVTGAGALNAASGATLDLTGGGALGRISNLGTLKLDGTTAYTFVGPLAAGILDVDAGATLSGTGTLSGSVADAGTIAASSGTLVLAGAPTGSGVLSAASGTTLKLGTAGTLTETATGLGTLNLGSSAATTFTLAGDTISTANLLVNAGVVIKGFGTISSAVSDTGALIASGGKLVLAGPITAAANLQALAGATLDLTAGGTLSQTISGTGTLELGGAYVFTKVPATTYLQVDAGGALGGAGTLASALVDNGSISATSGTLTLSGALTSGTGTLSAAAGAVLNIARGGSFAGALSGAGTVQLSAGTTLTAGASLSAAEVLQSSNILLGPGEKLTNQAGNLYAITASSGTTLALGGAGDTFTNAGTLAANGAGAVHVSTAIVNTGAISASAGTLNFLAGATNSGTISAAGGTAIFSAAVAGTGVLAIGPTSTLSLLAGSVAGQTVDFAATTGALDLTLPTHFLGTIAGFGGTDTIDLVNTVENGYTYTAGVLTVTENSTTVASLHFSGSYTQGEFTLGTDGHGGTSITV